MGDGKKKYESFEELYASAHRLVYLFIRDYTNDWYTAEELSSIIWLKVAEQPEFYLEHEILWVHNYIRVMVKNEFCEQYRIQVRRNRSLEKVAELSDIPKSAEEEIILKENLERLHSIRIGLSVEERQLLDLRFNQELSIKETGNAMGLKQSTVKMRQQRLLMKLRRMLD